MAKRPSWEEQQERRNEAERAVAQYSDLLIDRGTLKELAGLLLAVNIIIFGVVAWVSFGLLAPTFGDDRPAWLIWFVLGPLGGFLFGGFVGSMVWLVAANWLGEIILRRQGRPWMVELWDDYLPGRRREY